MPSIRNLLDLFSTDPVVPASETRNLLLDLHRLNEADQATIAARVKQVKAGLADGKSVSEIAHELDISISSVKYAINRIDQPTSERNLVKAQRLDFIFAQLARGRTVREIAEEMGCSFQYVHQLSKTIDPEKLQAAIRKAKDEKLASRIRPCETCGEPTQNPRFCSSACSGVPLRNIPREQEIVELKKKRVPDREIAQRLGFTNPNLIYRALDRAGVDAGSLNTSQERLAFNVERAIKLLSSGKGMQEVAAIVGYASRNSLASAIRRYNKKELNQP